MPLGGGGEVDSVYVWEIVSKNEKNPDYIPKKSLCTVAAT